jgi:putative FmdB family regulatory protein
MPEYDHICTNTECNHEWTEEYSIKQDPPKNCPKCNQETVKRLISLTGKGVVELCGQDLVDKVKSDAKNLEKEAYVNEKLYANLLGEGKYHDIQRNLDKGKIHRRS